MNKLLKKIIAQNSMLLENSEKNFKALYSIMFNQDAVLSEYTDGYRICTQTYKETKALIEEASCALKDKIGSTHGYVALDMENCPEWIVAFWSILRSGNKPYLVNCRHPKALSQAALKRLNITYIIGKESTELSGEFIDISSLRTDNRFDGDFEDEIALSTSATSLKEVICFYSGARFSAQILNVQSFIDKYPEIAEPCKGKIKQLAFLPFYHIFGLIAVYFWFTFYGQTVVFLKNMSPETIVKTCQKHEVTHVFGVPLLWHTIEKTILKKVKQKGEKTQKKFQKGLKLCTKLQNIFPHWGMKLSQKIMKEITGELFGQSVRFCISGGSFLRQSALELFNGIGYNLHNGYGMTEIGITSVELRMKPKHKNLNSIGAPFASVEYKIDENGILLVKGSSVCDKIWIEGEAVNEDEWFNTGDNMEYKDGVYYIKGRVGDMIIGESGENINPDLTEQSFFLPEAENFSILGLEENGKKLITMIVQISKYMSPSRLNALVDKVMDTNTKLPSTSAVQKFYFTTDPIASATAVKVSRKYLIREIENGNITLSDFKKSDEIPSEDETVYNRELLERVKAIVAAILDTDVSKITPETNVMIDLGADSMQYFSILNALAEEFSITASGKDELRYTIHDFCQYIERHL